MNENNSSTQNATDQLVFAALPHVPFDGWTEKTLLLAAADSQIPPALAKSLFPRGGVDMVLAFHRQGDEKMRENFAQQKANAAFSAVRYRDQITAAIRCRLEVMADKKEVVRRGVTLLSLPSYASDGLKALWQTSDHIWNALGDTSNDGNWYSKRFVLSGVYSTTIIYWLGDESDNSRDSWSFLDRRIEDVMCFEKIKGNLRKVPRAKALLSGPRKLVAKLRAPAIGRSENLPGRIWRRSL